MEKNIYGHFSIWAILCLDTAWLFSLHVFSFEFQQQCYILHILWLMLMTENSWGNIAGISYWVIFPSVKLPMHK